MGTTGGLLELLKRCVSLETFSDGFAAIVTDFVVAQAVRTDELVPDCKVALSGRQ